MARPAAISSGECDLQRCRLLSHPPAGAPLDRLQSSCGTLEMLVKQCFYFLANVRPECFKSGHLLRFECWAKEWFGRSPAGPELDPPPVSRRTTGIVEPYRPAGCPGVALIPYAHQNGWPATSDPA